MSNVAVRVENLGKRYRIGTSTGPYRTLREAIMEATAAPLRMLQRTGKNGSVTRTDGDDAVWALRDVSFEVKHGEVLGIIGRNGAGKSTLLKILSRITRPTTGRAVVHGRVGSLLEVGTGFHPELTGRDNIYLNGSILGMNRPYIERRFDEIVEFAGVQRFIDTPVKRYSSGMYLRLAFAVAAHLEPEVLVVDEVLAVGDAEFQKKCMGKMGEVAREGRTVMFVSHDMAAVSSLTSRAIWLHHGEIAAEGATGEIIAEYLRAGTVALVNLESTRRSGRGFTRFVGARFEDDGGHTVQHAVSGQPLTIALAYQSKSAELLQNCRASVAVYNSMGQVMFLCSSELTRREPLPLSPAGTIKCRIPRMPLMEGQYLLTLFLEVNREVEDFIDQGVILDISDGDFYGSGRVYPPGWRGKGVLVPHEWSIESRQAASAASD